MCFTLLFFCAYYTDINALNYGKRGNLQLFFQHYLLQNEVKSDVVRYCKTVLMISMLQNKLHVFIARLTVFCNETFS